MEDLHMEVLLENRLMQKAPLFSASFITQAQINIEDKLQFENLFDRWSSDDLEDSVY